jgi:hypothetical protein
MATTDFRDTASLAALLDTAHDEIRQQQDAHPEVAFAVSGAALMLRVSLSTARGMKCDPLARRHLAAAAQIAGQTLTGALDRHPRVAVAAEKLRDDALALTQIADLLRVEA